MVSSKLSKILLAIIAIIIGFVGEQGPKLNNDFKRVEGAVPCFA